MTEESSIDRIIARAVTETFFPEAARQDPIEVGMDDPRSPEQIKRDAEQNGGNPRLIASFDAVEAIAMGGSESAAAAEALRIARENVMRACEDAQSKPEQDQK